MQLYDKYPTDDPFKLFRKIEDNIGVLMYAFNRTAAKDNAALTKNIHYTILLPILKQIRHKEYFNQKLLADYEKKLLQMVLTYSTATFSISALMIHSKQLSAILAAGFSGSDEVKQLLNFANDAVIKSNTHTKCITNLSLNDYVVIRYVIAEVSQRQRLNTLFQYA